MPDTSTCEIRYLRPNLWLHEVSHELGQTGEGSTSSVLPLLFITLKAELQLAELQAELEKY